MKLQTDAAPGRNVITGYGADWIEVNRVRWYESILLPWEGEVQPWPVQHWTDLTEAHFEALSRLGAEVALLGTGSKQRFPSPRLTRTVTAPSGPTPPVGLEIMDTQAACRTFNILSLEGRLVAACLIVNEQPNKP